jgi:hypothetical protein
MSEYFIGIDSDGTVFNSMELKHKDCFIGSLIRIFDLAPIAHEIHVVWNYVNIFSNNRGTNRFKALLLTFNYLREMNVVKASNIKIPNLKILKKWIDNTEQLSNDSLLKFSMELTSYERFELESVIEWSEDVNRMVEITAINLPPMEGALEAMDLLKDNVDLVVISNTPLETLKREWSENNINNNILYIGGQETGTKTQMLKAVAENKYEPNKVLIIGDAPGDLKAAGNINALFFPIIPSQEEMSWVEFNKVGYGHFINNSYEGEYQNNQIQKFQSILNLAPPWVN